MNIRFPGEDYQEFGYPAGERQLRLTTSRVAEIAVSDVVTISARVHSPQDTMQLLLLADAIRGVNPGVRLNLSIPYLPYGRADRRFVEGDCAGLAVFGKLLNSVGFDSVTTIDAHNHVAAMNEIYKLADLRPTTFIRQSIVEFAALCWANELVVLFPDEGASKRYSVPSTILPCGNVVLAYATKKRNTATGAFEGFYVPRAEEIVTKPILIVDDICDGGGTFNGIAEVLKAATKPGVVPRLGLYVTHGVFSKGVGVLQSNFECIWTTNSFKDWPSSARLKVIPVM